MTKEHITVILAREFKLPHIDWGSYMASENCCESYQLVLDICFHLIRKHIVQKPTCITKSPESILDLVFASSAISSRHRAYEFADGLSDNQEGMFVIFLGPIRRHSSCSSRTVFDFEKSSDESIFDRLHYSLSQFENVLVSTERCRRIMPFSFFFSRSHCLNACTRRLLRRRKKDPRIQRQIIH